MIEKEIFAKKEFKNNENDYFFIDYLDYLVIFSCVFYNYKQINQKNLKNETFIKIVVRKKHFYFYSDNRHKKSFDFQ